MELTEIFIDSLNYPTKDWKKLVILGSLMTILVVLIVLTVFSVFTGNFLLIAVLGLITIISAIFIQLLYNGYSLRVTRETIENKLTSDNISSLPDFNLGENLVDGIKVIILNIVYLIIPTIITIIVANAIGLFNVELINQYLAIYSGSDISIATLEGFKRFNYLHLIVNLVNLILTLIFTFFMMIAIARLAETSRLSSIFEIREIFKTIAKIGWGNYIVWYIILNVIIFISSLIVLIPLIGILIIYIFIIPFLCIFEARALGLVYNESKQ